MINFKKAGLPAFLFALYVNMSGGLNFSKREMLGNVRSW